MNYIATQYDLKHKSLDIYFSGCKGPEHCKGCHNPSTWDFNNGKPCDEKFLEELKTKIESFDSMINNIFILGGEPLDQNVRDMAKFLDYLATFNKDIWLFTRYDLDIIPFKIQHRVDYIKTGRYIPELTVDDNIQYGIKLATSNQAIHKMERIK